MGRLRSGSDHASADSYKNKEHTQTSSLLEKCSFACHLFLFPLGLMYLSWIVLPQQILESPMVAAYCPNKDYALNVSITALFLFLAAPFLYSAFNSLTVPNVDSLYTVEDVYTKASTGTPICTEELKSFDSTLPEICDLDPSTLLWCKRNGKIQS